MSRIAKPLMTLSLLPCLLVCCSRRISDSDECLLLLRMYETALSCYQVDNDQSPERLSQLTTPIQYLISPPKDPLTAAAFRFERIGPSVCLVWSPGPDRRFQEEMLNTLRSVESTRLATVISPDQFRSYACDARTNPNGDIFVLLSAAWGSKEKGTLKFWQDDFDRIWNGVGKDEAIVGDKIVRVK